MKDLSVIGIGRLGLCFCLTLEKAGYNVVGHDINRDYIDLINDRKFFSFEPGVNTRLKSSKNFSATMDLKKAVDHGEMIFVTVRTESEQDGKYDVSQVDAVVQSLISLGAQKYRKHLIICSNVNPGYTDLVHKKLKGHNWDVSYNPETIAQGTILENQEEPDCVYIGQEDDALAADIEQAYIYMCSNLPSIHKMSRLEAELTKVSLNCFLTCKISFANMVGDLALKMGADPETVLQAVGSDGRIGNKFFRHGFGWGGPCFPRDTRAFIHLAKSENMPHYMCTASNESNKSHLRFQVEDFLESGQDEYHTDSVTYKKGTVILEESQQLKFAVALAKRGIKVTIKESEKVMAELKERFGDLFVYE
jgi:nucleotide sugar dehydrogenase